MWGVIWASINGRTRTASVDAVAVSPRHKPTIPYTPAPTSWANSTAAMRSGVTFCSLLPPPTEKVRSASRGRSRETRSQAENTVSQPSSSVLAISSDNVIGWGVDLKAAQLSEIVRRVPGMAWATADAQDEQKASPLPPHRPGQPQSARSNLCRSRGGSRWTHRRSRRRMSPVLPTVAVIFGYPTHCQGIHTELVAATCCWTKPARTAAARGPSGRLSACDRSSRWPDSAGDGAPRTRELSCPTRMGR